ncbi:MAG: DUF4229 domain-containing protein [Cryobacterium sp.]|nr:DUF4229 domain-containing protein [Cryobacterium sp.]
MSPSRRIILYSIIRVVLFAVPFIVFMLIGIWWWVSALTAAIIAACISYLFLNRQRHEVAEVVSSWGKGTHSDADNDVENEALDSREGDAR